MLFVNTVPQLHAQCTSLLGQPPTLSITTNDQNPQVAYPGCTLITYCFTVFGDDINLTAVPIVFTNNTLNGAVMLQPVNTGSFVEVFPGTFTGTFDIEAFTIYEFCLSFQIDPAFDEFIHKNIRATVTITHPDCPAAEVATYDNKIPAIPNMTLDNPTLLSTIIAGTGCPAPQGALLTPQAALMCGQEVMINDVLTVDVSSYTFTMNSTIILGPNAKIVIEDGSHLTIAGSSIVHGCTELWDAIEIKDGGRLTLNGATVKDGTNGVLMQDGAIFAMGNTTFLNNFKSITTTLGGGPRNLLLAITGPTTVSSDGNMLAPFTGQKAGWGIHFFNANFFLTGSGSNTITFRGIERGMDLTACNAIVEKLRFRDIEQFGIRLRGLGVQRTFEYIGFGIGSFDFDNMKTGITADDMNLDISNTSMRFLNTGMEISHCDRRKVSIYENQVIARHTGLGSFSNMPSTLEFKSNDVTIDDDIDVTNSAQGIGIRLDESLSNNGVYSLYRMLNNIVRVNNAQTGIRVQSGAVPRLTKNTVTLINPIRETYFGIDVQGSVVPIALCNFVNGNGSPANWHSGTAFNADGISDPRIRCNSMANSDVGFNFVNLGDATNLTGNLVNDHRLGLQINSGAFIGEQKHTGNQWLGISTYGGQGNNYQPINGNFGGFNGNLNPTLSRFFVDQVENPLFNTSVNVSNWFVNDPTPASSYFCSTNNTCPNGIGFSIDELSGENPKDIDILDHTIATGGLTPGICDSEVNWTGKRRLYRRLMENPSPLTGNALMQSFVNAESSTSVGLFYNMEVGLAGLFETTPANEALLAAQQLTIETEMHAIYSIDSTLAAGGLPQAQVDALMLQRTSHQATMTNEVANNDALVASINTGLASQVLQLAAANDAITATATPEINEQNVNRIFLQTVAVGVDTFTAIQTAGLLAIAEQCPPCGGDAVYRARGLYALIDKTADFSGVDCPGMGGRSSVGEDGEAQAPSHIGFAPNPASSEVTLSMPTSSREMELVVYALTGKVVTKKVIPDNTSRYRINTADMLPGAYFFSLLEHGKKVHTEQIVIIK